MTAGDGVAVSVEPWAKAGVAKTTRAAAETKILRILRVKVCIFLDDEHSMMNVLKGVNSDLYLLEKAQNPGK